MNTINNITNSNVPFTALTSVIYRGKFNPDKELLHAKTINSFVNSEHFKSLFKKYDVEAEFSATAAKNNKKAKASLDLYLSQIPTTFPAQLRHWLGCDKFKAHLNFTENNSFSYNNEISNLTSRIFSNKVKNSLVKRADKLFKEEEERKILINELRDKLYIHSHLDIMY